MELWKDIIGYEGLYQVSDLGNIKSLISDKIIKPVKCSRYGHTKASLYKDGIVKSFTVQVLVYNTFNNINGNGRRFHVDHINNDPTDNRLINLQLLSARDNAVKGFKRYNPLPTGVFKKGTRWQSKIYYNGRQYFLGSFVKVEDAAQAYLDAKNKIELETFNP